MKHILINNGTCKECGLPEQYMDQYPDCVGNSLDDLHSPETEETQALDTEFQLTVYLYALRANHVKPYLGVCDIDLLNKLKEDATIAYQRDPVFHAIVETGISLFKKLGI